MLTFKLYITIVEITYLIVKINRYKIRFINYIIIYETYNIKFKTIIKLVYIVSHVRYILKINLWYVYKLVKIANYILISNLSK